MYGAYNEIDGEQQVYNFLEMAISDEPITKLEDGLHGTYFIGFQCQDHTVCNFAKASPHHKSWWNRAQTPAYEQFFLR
jgi:hypothetical protein